MTTNRYKYFRWTKRTARITFLYIAVVPTVFTTLAYQTDVSMHDPNVNYENQQITDTDDTTQRQGKWDLRGKRRGDPLSEY